MFLKIISVIETKSNRESRESSFTCKSDRQSSIDNKSSLKVVHPESISSLDKEINDFNVRPLKIVNSFLKLKISHKNKTVFWSFKSPKTVFYGRNGRL